MCPNDDRPTRALAESGDRTGEPPAEADPLLSAYRLEVYWGSDECGGMYRGVVLATGTAVSVRIVRPDLSADEAYALAFDQQAERCRQVATHHVAKVLDRGRTSDGRLFLVTEYVRGRSLRQLIDDREHFGWVRVREITLQLLEGLAEGHRAGLVHWDLRPEVIWLETVPGGGAPNLRITGFGLPWWPPRGPNNTGGTHPSAYAAPQRFTGGVIEERSDLYALGACLFHLLTGNPPFAAQLAPEAALERRAGNRPRLSVRSDDVPKDIPEGFLELVHRLMAWSPADRPRDADEVTRTVTSLPEAVADDTPGGETPGYGGAAGPTREGQFAYGCPVAARRPSWFDRLAASANARWLIGVLLVLAIVALLWLLLVAPAEELPARTSNASPRDQSRATMAMAKPEQLSSVAPCIWRARS